MLEGWDANCRWRERDLCAVWWGFDFLFISIFTCIALLFWPQNNKGKGQREKKTRDIILSTPTSSGYRIPSLHTVSLLKDCGLAECNWIHPFHRDILHMLRWRMRVGCTDNFPVFSLARVFIYFIIRYTLLPVEHETANCEYVRPSVDIQFLCAVYFERYILRQSRRVGIMRYVTKVALGSIASRPCISIFHNRRRKRFRTMSKLVVREGRHFTYDRPSKLQLTTAGYSPFWNRVQLLQQKTSVDIRIYEDLFQQVRSRSMTSPANVINKHLVGYS
jgi:hypothetical protein